MDESLQRAGAAWDAHTLAAPVTTHWYNSPFIRRHVNKLIAGVDVGSAPNSGVTHRLKAELGGKCAQRAVSIGCGEATKELHLVSAGLVEHFDLYEVSNERLAVAERNFASSKLSHAMNGKVGNAFEEWLHNKYDLVYWDCSLHHMMNVDEALSWSYKALRPGGLIFIVDFIGPSRFQWSDRNLLWIERVRKLLPREILEMTPGVFLPLSEGRIDPAVLDSVDPSEAADSAHIVSAAQQYFRTGAWTMLGGAIFLFGLKHIAANFERLGRTDLLEICLLVDEALSALGENTMGLFIARKP